MKRGFSTDVLEVRAFFDPFETKNHQIGDVPPKSEVGQREARWREEEMHVKIKNSKEAQRYILFLCNLEANAWFCSVMFFTSNCQCAHLLFS